MVNICTKHFTHKLEAETFKTFFNPIQKQQQQQQLLLLFSLWSLNFCAFHSEVHYFFFDLMFTEAIISILYNSDIVYLWKHKPILWLCTTKIKYNQNAYTYPSFLKIMQKCATNLCLKIGKNVGETWQCNNVLGFFLKLQVA